MPTADRCGKLNGMSEVETQKHAPWWVYVVLIIGANLGKQQLMPEDAGVVLTAGSTIVTIAVTYWLITVVYRNMVARK